MSAETILPENIKQEADDAIPRIPLRLVGVVIESVNEFTPKPTRVFDSAAEKLQIQIDSEVMSSYPQTD